MASVTLAESAKLAQDLLVAGVIEDVITVNQAFEVMPFDGISGNALAYNRENALGDVQVAGVGSTVTAKAAATFTHLTSSLTTIIGDAEVNGLIQATRSNDTDQTQTQIGSKAKSCGRQYQDMFINGTGASNQFAGLKLLNTQLVVAGGGGGNGAVLSFTLMDETMDMVTDKDGAVDFIMGHARTIRAFKVLLRALGGASINDVLQLPSGRKVAVYNDVPFFRNDWIAIDETQGSATNASSLYFGTWDDGSRTHGVAGLTAESMAGIQVVDVGEKEDADERIWRVKWYTGLACFSEKGLARLSGIIPA